MTIVLAEQKMKQKNRRETPSLGQRKGHWAGTGGQFKWVSVGDRGAFGMNAECRVCRQHSSSASPGMLYPGLPDSAAAGTIPSRLSTCVPVSMLSLEPSSKGQGEGMQEGSSYEIMPRPKPSALPPPIRRVRSTPQA